MSREAIYVHDSYHSSVILHELWQRIAKSHRTMICLQTLDILIKYYCLLDDTLYDRE